MFQNKKAGLLLRVIFIALVIYLVVTLVTLQNQVAAAKAEITSLSAQIENQKQVNTELSNAIENSDDPSFIKDVAREKLGLVSPGDKVFYISD